MNKLLIVLLISLFAVVFEKRDYSWIEVYGDLEDKGYLPIIENALRSKGEIAATDICVGILSKIYGRRGRRLSHEDPIPSFYDDDDTKGNEKGDSIPSFYDDDDKGNEKGDPIPSFYDDDDDKEKGNRPERENPRYKYLCQQIIESY